jgi:hypothetical protein
MSNYGTIARKNVEMIFVECISGLELATTIG